jgi:hypothetical protein
VTTIENEIAHLNLEPITDLRLEVPPEPTEMRDWMRSTILSGGDPRKDFTNDVCFGVWIWERWRAALEPAGFDREAFVDVIESYGREIWLWIIGERLWAQCIEGLAGRVARRLPAT